MKKLTYIFILTCVFAMSSFAQNINTYILDEQLNREVLVGYADRSGLRTGEFAEYFEEDYQNYSPDSSVLDKLKPSIHNYAIVVVLGTWCGDSKVYVPAFLKVLDETNYPETQLTIIGVDKSKKAGGVDITTMNIVRVPTFIIYKENAEVGRIIESPDESLELDLLKIIQP